MSIEVSVARQLLKALESLETASLGTQIGFVSDYCENAAREIRKAVAACISGEIG